MPLNSLGWFRKNEIWKLYAFCLMPSHLHILVQLLSQDPIENIMGRFHSFTGHKIADQLEQLSDQHFIPTFQEAAFRKGDRELLIWEDSLAKCIETEHVLLETIEYIHNNPVNKNLHLVDDRADYRYSSACYYDRGQPPLIEIDDYQELLGETPSR